jgi:hypothetical protein
MSHNEKACVNCGEDRSGDVPAEKSLKTVSSESYRCRCGETVGRTEEHPSCFCEQCGGRLTWEGSVTDPREPGKIWCGIRCFDRWRERASCTSEATGCGCVCAPCIREKGSHIGLCVYDCKLRTRDTIPGSSEAKAKSFEYWIEDRDGNEHHGPFETYEEAAKNCRIAKGEKIVNRDVPRSETATASADEATDHDCYENECGSQFRRMENEIEEWKSKAEVAARALVTANDLVCHWGSRPAGWAMFQETCGLPPNGSGDEAWEKKKDRFDGLRFEHIGTEDHLVTCGFCGCRTSGFGLACCEKGVEAQRHLSGQRRPTATAEPVGDVHDAAKALVEGWERAYYGRGSLGGQIRLSENARQGLVNTIAAKLWGLRPTTTADLGRERATDRHPVTGEPYEAIMRTIGAEKQRLREKNHELHTRAQRVEAALHDMLRLITEMEADDDFGITEERRLRIGKARASLSSGEGPR